MVEVLSKGGGAKGYIISCYYVDHLFLIQSLGETNSNKMREIILIVELVEGSHSSQDVAAYFNSASKVICKYAKCFGVLPRIVKLQ